MRKFLLSALAMSPLVVCAQSADSSFSVTGKIGNLNAPAVMYIGYQAGGKFIKDSAVLTNGAFTLKGTAPASPVQAYLIFSHDGAGMNTSRDYLPIFLERGNIVISEVADSVSKATPSGTPTNKDLAELNKAQAPVQAIQSQMEARSAAASAEEKASPEFNAAMSTLESQADELSNTIAKKFVKSHPQSFLSLNQLQELAYPLDYGELAPLFKGLSPAVRESESGKKFASLLETMKKVAIGNVAPDFSLPDTAGTVVKLSSLRGKYVLIDMWASWCGPCRAENPNVVKVYNKYKDNNFTVIGVSLDQPTGKEKWKAAIQKDGLTWTQVSDLKFWNSEVAKDYGVQAIPQNFLLDPQGKIIAKNLRGDALDKKVAAITSGKKG